MAIPVDLKVGTNIQNFKLTCTDLDSNPRSFRYSIASGTVLGINSSGPSREGCGSHTDVGTAWVCEEGGPRDTRVPVFPSAPSASLPHLVLPETPTIRLTPTWLFQGPRKYKSF